MRTASESSAKAKRRRWRERAAQRAPSALAGRRRRGAASRLFLKTPCLRWGSGAGEDTKAKGKGRRVVAARSQGHARRAWAASVGASTSKGVKGSKASVAFPTADDSAAAAAWTGRGVRRSPCPCPCAPYPSLRSRRIFRWFGRCCCRCCCCCCRVDVEGSGEDRLLWPTRSVAPPPAVGWSPLVPARVSGGQRKTVVVHVCQERGTVEGKRLDLQ